MTVESCYYYGDNIVFMHVEKKTLDNQQISVI